MTSAGPPLLAVSNTVAGPPSAISAPTTSDRVRSPSSPTVNTSSMTMATAARFGWNTTRHSTSSGTTTASTPSGKRLRAARGKAATKARTPMSGVRPVILCSRRGSTSRATKAIRARTMSTSGARSSPCHPDPPRTTRRTVTARNAEATFVAWPERTGRILAGHRPAPLDPQNEMGDGKGFWRPTIRGVRWPDAAERSPAGGDLSAEETVMRSLARWCVRHRLALLGIWLMVLVGTLLGQSALGSHYATGTTLTGTPSAAAANLLQRAVPGQSGDTAQIVFQTKTGTVRAPAVQKQIQTM